MSTEIGKTIQELAYDSGLSVDNVRKMVEEALLTAYKKKYGTTENTEVEFDELTGDVKLYSKKEVIKGVYNPVFEIEYEEAIKYDASLKEGDFILIEVDPKEEFGRISVQNAKQKTRSDLKEIQRDSLFSELSEKKGKIIKGNIRRKKRGKDSVREHLYIEIDRISQRFEAILPEKNQSPRESYDINDSIRALVWDVQKATSGIQVTLTRSHKEFIAKLFEQEIPEISEGLVQIHNIVRDAGYRTKMAVKRMRDEIDPVGACVGAGGSRIQNIIRETEGEKIDVIEYSTNIKEYIRASLSPAQVEFVLLQDEEKRQALVVVSENQLSFAIGKNGQNVRLANRLVDWTLDVKTQQQFIEIYGEDALPSSATDVNSLFMDSPEYEENVGAEEIISDNELPKEGNFLLDELIGLDTKVLDLLKSHGHNFLEPILELDDEELLQLEGFSQEFLTHLRNVIDENVELVEDERNEFICPECKGKVQQSVNICPHCGVGLSFEFEEE